MKDDLSQDEAEQILKALDDAIQEGPWQNTKFLTAIGKKLQAMRADFKQKVDAAYGKGPVTTSHLANRVALRSGQQMIYVSLYSAAGTAMNTWERIVYNLASQVITRPMYSNEQDVRAMVRSKANIFNEAYVSIYVRQSDILSPALDKIPHDKLGHELLTLKDKSLKLDNVVQFFHQTGVYHYEHGRLIRDGDFQITET